MSKSQSKNLENKTHDTSQTVVGASTQTSKTSNTKLNQSTKEAKDGKSDSSGVLPTAAPPPKQSSNKPKEKTTSNQASQTKTARPDEKKGTAPLRNEKGKGNPPVRESKVNTPKQSNTKTADRKRVDGSKGTGVIQIQGEYVKWSFVKAITSKDAAYLSTDPASYVTVNLPTYYVAINTWLAMISDVSKEPFIITMMTDYLAEAGLVRVIADCQASADVIIGSYSVDATSDRFITDYREALGKPIAQLLTRGVFGDDATALQILRFLKRFSPLKADILLKGTYDDFLKINERCNRWSHDTTPEYPAGRTPKGVLTGTWAATPADRKRPTGTSSQCWYLESSLSDILSKMLKSFQKEYDKAFDSFSNGSSQNGRTLIKKLKAFAANQPYWQHQLYPLGTPGGGSALNYEHVTRKSMRSYEKSDYWYSKTHSSVLAIRYSVKPTSVPKSYKNGRIIAPEHAYIGAKLQPVREAMVRALSSSIYKDRFVVEDQTENEELCRIGSIDGSYATIDLTGASDSLSKALMFRILPIVITRITSKYLARYLKAGEEEIRCGIYATSGNPITFVTLGCVCLAICILAEQIHTALTKEKVKPSHIFGDDCCVDARIYDLVCDIMSRLGLVVNLSKSYTVNSTYRESCGTEYSQGYDLRSTYWPRTTFDFSDVPRTLVSLISLQQKLHNRYWNSQRMLLECVKVLASSVGHKITCGPTSDNICHPTSDVRSLKRCKTKSYGDLKRVWNGSIPMTPSLKNCISQWNSSHSMLDQIDIVYDEDNKRATVYDFQYTVISHDRDPRPANAFFEMYSYVEWLRKGPQYDGKLDELLGISQKPSYAAVEKEVSLSIGYSNL